MKLSVKKRVTAAWIVVGVLCLLGVPACLIFNPDFAAKVLPYDMVNQYLLYDHITYNGVDYYLMDDGVPTDIDKGRMITDGVYVILVDKDGNPYDAEQTEQAWFYADDPERLYIHFNSADYTKDISLASEMYGFNK